MSNKNSDKKDQNNQNNQQSNQSLPKIVKMREDTIPVIVVNGVYYPS